MLRLRLTLSLVVAVSVGRALAVADLDDFRVRPYLQNPSSDGITIRWLSEQNESGTVTVERPEGLLVFTSKPERHAALRYNPFKPEPGDSLPELPWLHRVRVTGLTSGLRYRYRVLQGTSEYTGEFMTAPSADSPVRLIAYADSETEPESSTSPPVDWPESSGSNRPEHIRRYPVDQTVGYHCTFGHLVNSCDQSGECIEQGFDFSCSSLPRG